MAQSSPAADMNDVPGEGGEPAAPALITQVLQCGSVSECSAMIGDQVEGVFMTRLPEEYHIPEDPIVLEGDLSRSGKGFQSNLFSSMKTLCRSICHAQ